VIVLICRFLTDEDKKAICSWKYEGDYSIYSLPSYESLKQSQSGFMNPEKENNYSVFKIGDDIIGYINLIEREAQVYIGIGVNPNFLNKGFGTQILLESYKLSKEIYPQKPLGLEVRSWNKRAIRCYEKAGFVIDGEAYEMVTPVGADSFYRMKKI
jgi:RimJ/RimL family protein N-acetyltransferase